MKTLSLLTARKLEKKRSAEIHAQLLFLEPQSGNKKDTKNEKPRKFDLVDRIARS